MELLRSAYRLTLTRVTLGEALLGCAPLALGGHVIEKRREQRIAPHRGRITHERQVTARARHCHVEATRVREEPNGTSAV